MHHRTYEEGAHEEIAFPGFTIIAFCILAIAIPVWSRLRAVGARPLFTWAAACIATGAIALAASALLHTMLAGVLVIIGALVVGRLRRVKSPFPPLLRLELWLVLLSVVMYLGMYPFAWEGEPVRGLYYYFHTYVPGFNGIRKVSRQACMTTFTLVILSAFGARALFSTLARSWMKAVALVFLVGLVCWEFRTFPNKLDPLWAGNTVPAAYKFIAEQPGDRPVAILPAYFGRKRFRSHRGMAIHNYMALHHRRRTLNGKSSFIPPVTRLVHQALRGLPSPNATRILNILDAEYVLIHGEDLEPQHRKRLIGGLDHDREHYEKVFQDRHMYVYRLRPQQDPTMGLLPWPKPPEGSRPIKPDRARASRRPQHAQRAIDNALRTGWATFRNMRKGDWFELTFDAPVTMTMLELRNRMALTDHPLSFKLEVEGEDGRLQAIYTRPQIKLVRELVYRPKGYVFRAKLPEPTTTRRLRITIVEPVSYRWWTIDEARVWVKPGPAEDRYSP